MTGRPNLPLGRKVKILERQALCFYCGQPLVPSLEGEVEYDHKRARALGGSDDDANLVAAHAKCHREKTDRDLKKIAFENRRAKKRTRAAEKRALKELAKKDLLQRYVTRGSEPINGDDYVGTGGPIGGEDSGAGANAEQGDTEIHLRRTKKTWASAKGRWPKRSFPKNRGRSDPVSYKEDHPADEE